MPAKVPHFDFRKLAAAPQQNGHMTPRIRHFADDQVKVSNAQRKSALQNATKDVLKKVKINTLLTGKAPGRLSMLKTDLGLVKNVAAVSLPTGE